MEYLKKNKLMFYKYMLVIIFNIIIYILTNFYFNSSDSGTIVMLIVVLIIDLFILNYKEKTIFKYYLDIICNILIGFILLIFINDFYYYSTILLSLYLSNNIVFMRSRISDKFLKRSLQYLLTFFITIFCMFINLLIVNILF